MQPPPPGPPPQWGPPPDEPWEHTGPGFGGQPGQENYGQPPPPGYGPPQWGGYGPPVPVPTSQQTIGWISLAAIGLLGLLGGILTLTLWINLNSAVSRAADVCNRFAGEYGKMCRHQIHTMVPTVPVALVACLFLIIAACLAVAAGAVMLFLRRPLGQFLILGGGIVMLVLSIGLEARYGATGRITYDLIAGLVIAVTGGLMFIPAFRVAAGTATAPDGRAQRISGRRAVAAGHHPSPRTTALPGHRTSGERPGQVALPHTANRRGR